MTKNEKEQLITGTTVVMIHEDEITANNLKLYLIQLCLGIDGLRNLNTGFAKIRG